MKIVTTLCATICLAALIVVPGLQAQDLVSGKWTGTVAPPNEVIDVTYDIETANDTLTVMMNAPMGSFPFRNINVDGDHITFTWSTRVADLNCDLERQEDGSYTGDCVLDNGNSAQMLMVPPKKERHGEND